MVGPRKENPLTDDEYLDEALLQYTQLSTLPSPDPYNVESFRKWLASPSVDDQQKIGGGGGEEDIWGVILQEDPKTLSLHRRFIYLLWYLVAPRSEQKRQRQQVLDLVATKPTKEVDFLTRWVMEEFIPFYNDVRQASFLQWLKSLRDDIKTLMSLIRKVKKKKKANTDTETGEEKGIPSPLLHTL